MPIQIFAVVRAWKNICEKF